MSKRTQSREQAPEHDREHDRGAEYPDRAVQLRLLPGRAPRRDWVLDERTRTVGRQGVAHAREILRQARPPDPARKAS